ncbi:hypothetical protein [Nostoc sp.]|uniref:hypothetical protein n=1 Tax=Nostoc sp. TaxID=1180 RepID=UPI002FF487CB
MNAALSLINLRMLWTQSATVATMLPFRLLCQVAHAVARSQQLRFIRRLYAFESDGNCV